MSCTYRNGPGIVVPPAVLGRADEVIDEGLRLWYTSPLLGTFRTRRYVSLESVQRSKADIANLGPGPQKAR
jgi:hypothetical protein